MSPEDLEKFVATADSTGLADATANLTEAERRKLSKTAQSLKREIESVRWTNTGTRREPLDRLMGYLGLKKLKKKVELWDQLRTADLALLAVGPRSAIKKTGIRRPYGESFDQEYVGVRILCDRRPEWIDELIDDLLSGDLWTIDWDTLRQLIKKDVCRKPTSDGYYRLLTQMSSHRRYENKNVTLSEELAAEPELLDDLWKFFEVDTDAFAYEWDHRADSTFESWPTAFRNLAASGHLDRARLLDATLAGLTTGFKQNILSGFARLHESLEPTGDEMAARQMTYSDLISSPVSQVVSFTIKMIKKLDKEAQLDDEALVLSAGRVFDVRTKGPPKSVITLFKKVARRRPNLARQVGRALVPALDHPAEDVQSAAIDLLATLADKLDTSLASQIYDRLDSLPATIRPQAAQLVGKLGGTVEDAPVAESTVDVGAALAECRERAAALDPRWRKLAGIDDAIAAVESSTWAGPLDFEMTDVPLLSAVDSVEPIESMEQLIDEVAHALESVESAINVERILDGMSRLSDQRTDDFECRVAPLVKRAAKIANAEARGIANQSFMFPQLSHLLGVWLADSPDRVLPDYRYHRDPEPVCDFINARLEALCVQLESRRAAPLLAMPTHERGWIEPTAIVARWQEIENRDLEPNRYDLMQALLRMAPEGRDVALTEAAKLAHPWARPLRWALGSDDAPQTSDERSADVWLTAGRCRSPYARLNELVDLKLEDAGPDAVEPAQYHWSAKIRETHHQDETYRHAVMTVDVRPDISKKMAKQWYFPTVGMHAPTLGYSPYGANGAWIYDWVSLVWPAKLDGVFANAIRAMMKRIDDTSSTLDPNHEFLNPLFDADRPLSKIARLMAVIGIAGRDQDVRGLAIDAVVETIADGRLHPDQLGETLTTLTTRYWLKLNRLSETLAEVARVSPLHAWTTMIALDRLLASYDELPRDAHYLLALLQQLHAQFGLPLVPEAANILEGVKGASKTAKLAKALNGFAPAEPTAACDEARLAKLESRLTRAERWAGVCAMSDTV
ncbi:MAG: hypothetical protein DWQ35_22545 [Planctomycetota bacterium]|nr:MAG: hypothetical protein DWQ35_22545 [Planctomycetota bacterium]REK24931.1 MAG: hypothetical protein DWQ42_12625 [Planctomycetota bacterium]REK48520.1 MAG: hypothetical protein DWQ46_02155 [Planctomycetota bacterium]